MIIVFNEVNIVNICTIDEITLMKLLEFNFGYLTSLFHESNLIGWTITMLLRCEFVRY